ncbi:MAG: hypothetical protein OEY07_08465, partial [Gammaproteobacteria bacterium]|nr:hypothetical protein [Gammaproteobacteria bacterium]
IPGIYDRLDRNASILTPGPRGMVFGIMSMKFNVELMQDLRLFRLKENQTSLLLMDRCGMRCWITDSQA